MPWRLCALLLGVAVTVFSQNISGGLSGTVVDSLAAPFAGTTVTVSNETTGFVRSTTTNVEGFFSFPDLTPGTFTLTITAPGFKKYAQSGIAVGSGEQRSLQTITLQIGDTTESVTVTAESVPVQLGSSERGSNLTQEEIQNMALRGRDVMDAIGLLPGVVDTDDSRESSQPDSIGSIYILGGRSNQKNMTIDGVTNLDTGSNGSVHTMPSMDSIGEVKVLMSNYAAEYGRNSGGTITVITRGGQKRFNGSAGWYHRHESYTANTFFNNEAGLPRPLYRYNSFSYTYAGPIYIPKKFNRSREKLFFFWSQEFQHKNDNPGVRKVNVPTELERNGDFSQSFEINQAFRAPEQRTPILVRDPMNRDANGNSIQFPGNVIPKSRFSPIGQKILALFPLPNFVDPVPTRRYDWNYLSQRSAPYPRHTETVRVDYSPRANLQTYVRFSNNGDRLRSPYGEWVHGSVNFPLTDIEFRRPGRGGTVHTTFTVSPTLFSQTIFGLSQNKLYFHPADPQAVSREATGILVPQFNPGLNPAGIIPNMTFGGGVGNPVNASMSDGIPYYNSNTIFSLVENLSKVHGTHVFKFGVYLERTRKDQSANAATRGRIAFDRTGSNPLDTNHPFANALLGIYRDYSEATARPQGHYRFTNLEWYFQDAWRVRPRLLLDYGVRFYHDMPQYDARLQLATFVPSMWDPKQAPVLLMPALDQNRKKMARDPITGRYYPEGLIGTFLPGSGNPANGMVLGGRNGWPRGMYSIPPLSLAPRVGFAWDPFGRGRTAVRGGVGVFYDRIQGNPTMNLLSNPPTIFTPTVYYGTLENLKDVSSGGVLAPSGITSLIGHVRMPTVYNYSFGLQQQIGRDLMIDASYVGSFSRHLPFRTNINPVPVGAQHSEYWAAHPEAKDPTRNNSLPDNFLRPYQGYADIHFYSFGGTSNYNSFQFSSTRRIRRNGDYIAVVYTWSKALGSAATDTTNVSPFFPPRQRNYGLLPYDRSHVASIRYSYHLPNAGRKLHSRVLGVFADGWQLAGTTRIQTGEPFTPSFQTLDNANITGTGSEGARVDVIDPAAPPELRFGRPARGTFGNAGVGVLRAPGMNNWDVSAFKNIRLAERRSLQLRFETYNTLNHTQWSNVDRQARFDQAGAQIKPTFLAPNATRPPRRIQLSLRLNF